MSLLDDVKIHGKFMNCHSGLCISVPVNLVNVSLLLQKESILSVCQISINQSSNGLIKISGLKTDSHVLVNYQGKYFIVNIWQYSEYLGS